MQKLILFGFLAVAGILGLQSFGNDGGTNPSIQADSVCFMRDVLPILNSNCAMSNCHDAISHKEGFTFTTYAGVMKGVKAGSSTSSELYKEIANDKMPENPYTKLTAAQKLTIKNWIDQGAKNSSCETIGCDSVNVTFSTIKPIIANNCLGCHSGATAQAGIDLSTDQNIDDMKETILCTIIQASYCKPMPYNGLKLTNCEKGMINRWVELSSTGNIQNGDPIVQAFNITPNTVKDGAVIRFRLEKRQTIAMSLYGYDGKKIRIISTGDYSEGQHELQFEAGNLPAGVYFVRIEAGGTIQSLMFTH